ncbi:MAG: hypothetical protein ABI192_05085 [Bradyrhizobium sp.]
MVNYFCDVETIASDHDAFVNDGIVMHSADVDALLSEPVPVPNLGAA